MRASENIATTPLDKTFFIQCQECNKFRMIGTHCKNPQTKMCDNDNNYFYKDDTSSSLFRFSNSLTVKP